MTSPPLRQLLISWESDVKQPMLLVAAVAALQGCATPSQIDADAEVRRLCAIDGGVTVYETVRLPPNRFDEYGNFIIQNKDAASDSDYYIEREDIYLLTGSPRIIKYVHRVIRRADGKTMGMSVRYGRGGGDVPGPWATSSFFCPSISKDTPSVVKSVFIKEEPK